MAHTNATPAPAAIAALQTMFKGREHEGWEHVWKLKVTPWDVGCIQPPLKEILESGEVPFPIAASDPDAAKPRVLVPGCGTGYDAIYLAETLNADALGIDISPTANQAAQTHLQSRGPLASGSVAYQVADFFSLSPTSKFDVIYDYTFFVAIPPAQRPRWASQMASLLKEGGYLITLAFPMDPYTEAGPPFYVRPEHYEEVLLKGELEGKFVKLVDRVPKTSTEIHKGRERLMVWKRLQD